MVRRDRTPISVEGDNYGNKLPGAKKEPWQFFYIQYYVEVSRKNNRPRVKIKDFKLIFFLITYSYDINQSTFAVV